MDFKKSWGLCVALTLIATGMVACSEDDPTKCGEVYCSASQECKEGVCVDKAPVVACGEEQELCGTKCADLKNDDKNCGACGNVCLPGSRCQNSECVSTCSGEGKKVCGDKCANTKSDRANCGDCGVECQGLEQCIEGACVYSCPENLKDCNGNCVDVKNDRYNCGDCGVECEGAEYCAEGACGIHCTDKQELCGDLCVNKQTDINNCGGCGVECTDGEVCIEGNCKVHCVEGLTVCGSTCTDTKKDANNCGGCGTVCKGGENCVDSNCVLACPGNQTVCGDECVNIKTNSLHCGDCNNPCEGSTVCEQGMCKEACPEGFALREFELTESVVLCNKEVTEDCSDICSEEITENCVIECSEEVTENCCKVTEDGLNCVTKIPQIDCVSLTSSENCGAVGTKCAEDERCIDGKCSNAACQEGQAECAGGCIDSSKSLDYCGAKGSCNEADEASPNFYGVACGDDQSCVNGACVCDAGLSFCKLDEDMLSCVDPKTSVDYCGCTLETAGTNCALLENVAESSCDDGGCKILKCAEGFADCNEDASDGCEIEIASDVENCGACGTVCPNDNVVEDGLACTNGACTPTCEEGFGACDGKCIDITNTSNCGGCGNVCGANMICKQSVLTKTYGCQLPETVCEVVAEATGEYDYATVNVDGTEKKAYCIKTKADFEAIRTELNAGRNYPNGNKDNAFILMRDIKLHPVKEDALEEAANPGLDGISSQTTWSPIGSSSKPFTGIVLGNNHIISGKVACKTSDCSIFGYVSGATIDGIDFDMTFYPYINSAKTGKSFYDYVGVIAGRAYNSTISNNYFKGSVTGSSYVGGLVGYAENTKFASNRVVANVNARYSTLGGLIGRGQGVTISDSSFEGNVKSFANWTGNANIYMGGLAGVLTEQSGVGSKVSNVTVKGTVTAENHTYQTTGLAFDTTDEFLKNESQWYKAYVGGVVGDTKNTTYENVTATNELTAPIAYYAGGLVGRSNNAKFNNCSATASITKGYARAGGFVGEATSDSQFDKCSATGDVVVPTTTSGLYVGGFAGYISTGRVDNSKATGNVEVTTTSTCASGCEGRIGGFAGYMGMLTSVVNNTASGNVKVDSKLYHVGGFTGYIETATKFENNHATGDVTGRGYIGGLLGYARRTPVKNCSATGDVSIADFNMGYDLGSQIGYGGLVGYGDGCNYEDSSATGNVKGFASTGGFVGRNGGNSTYERCAAFGNVETNPSYSVAAGAFIGNIQAGQAITLNLCMATGDVSGQYAGGLVCTHGAGINRISDSYATGKMTSTTGKAGVLVANMTGGRLTTDNVYWWKDGSENAYMKTGGTFTTNSKYDSFEYSGKTPIIMEGERTRKLVNFLNASQDAWSSVTCSISSGPANGVLGDYNLPVLRGMKINVCK